MNNVPLLQGNSTQEINTSIIALKKAAKELEDLNTLVNQKLAEVNEALSKEINDVNTSLSEEIDNVNTSLSEDISDLQDTISALDLSQVGGSGYYIESISQTDGQVSASAQSIANSVTSDNTHSVSSQAVYNYDKLDVYNTINDANECIPDLMKEKRYLLANSNSASNVPVSVGGVVIVAMRQYYSTPVYQSVFQLAYQQGTSELCDNIYIRQAYSTDSGSTWTWGDWVKLVKKTDFNNLPLIGQTNSTGLFTLSKGISNYSVLLIGVTATNSTSERTNTSIFPTLIIQNRNSESDSVAVSITFGSYINSYLFHYVDDTHLYVDQKSVNWATTSRLLIWGIN